MGRIRLAVRQLVEFLLRTGDIDSRFAGFDRANEGARIHRKLQKSAGEGYSAEVSLSAERTVCGVDFTVEGRADGIFTDETGQTVIDEIKTTAVPAEQITEELNFCHWAQGMVYAAIYGRQNSLSTLSVRLTYYQIDDDKVFYFTRNFDVSALENFLIDLLTQYAPWAQRQLSWGVLRRESLTALQFPFPQYRVGQRAMAGEVYRACRSGPDAAGGGRIFCQAPTGIGKTMSTLFPALKAMGEGFGEKAFYLTARTTTRAAAETAIRILRQRTERGVSSAKAFASAQAEPPSPSRVQCTRSGADKESSATKLHLRCITLAAKDKVCLCKNAEGRPECTPEACPYARGYYDRVREAVAAVLDSGGDFDRGALEQAARAYTVCPFELGLDVSEWCDIIIGDYNYLFDPVVHLRRFFDASGDWLFLVDEAHNLPDRARAMYSASFVKSLLGDTKKALGKGKSALRTALTKADKTLLAYRRLCDALAASPPDSGSSPSFDESSAPFDTTAAKAAFPVRNETKTVSLSDTAVESDSESTQTSLSDTADSLADGQPPLFAEHGTVFFKTLPKALAHALRALLTPAQEYLEEHREGPAHEAVLSFYFVLRDFVRVAERCDEHYVVQFTARASELHIHLLCLDPSAFVNESLNTGRAAALFSATLTPPGYYKNILGCPDARAVALQSPFPPENLGLYCLPGISTRYRQRAQSLVPIADALAAMAEGRTGNYMAFFPSYAYLRQVFDVFAERHPKIETLVQQSGLDDAGRDAFLSRFVPDPQNTLLGFGVLGGVFGEGIDLSGERLIGCAVVGVGLPQVNPQQEMLRRYFEEKDGCGFDYAYRFPGMNKVLQAAGRVIRTAQDRGVVLLLDDRFALREYRRLFPPHWSQLRYLNSTEALKTELSSFWGGAKTVSDSPFPAPTL